MRLYSASFVSITLAASAGCVATSHDGVESRPAEDHITAPGSEVGAVAAQLSPLGRRGQASSRATGVSSLVGYASGARAAAGEAPILRQSAATLLVPSGTTCPSEPIALTVGTPLTIADTTTIGSADNVQPWCESATGTLDRVYQLEVPTAGVLRLDVTAANGFVPVFELRPAGCSTPSNFDACFVGPTSPVMNVVAGTYWLVIDGTNPTGAGDFNATVTLSEPYCQDGVVSGAEQCDDGNSTNGDGCDNDCTFTPAGPGDTCDGQAVTLTADGLGWAAQITGYTSGYTDDYSGSCSSAAGGKDRVYWFIAPLNGVLQVDVGKTVSGGDACVANPYGNGCFDRVLYVREGTCASGAELGCSDNQDDGAAIESLVGVPIIQEHPYFVFVDGHDDAFYSYGTFVLNLKLSP